MRLNVKTNISVDSTENKLIMLFMLDKMEIPLTENSILEICSSQNNWVNWMDCKDLLSQLIVEKFVYRPNTDSDENRYNITVAGRECLSQFYTRIPASLRDNIAQFAQENKLQFKRNQEYIAKSYKNEDGNTKLWSLFIKYGNRSKWYGYSLSILVV